MRIALADLPMTVGTTTIPITASFGVAIRQPGETCDALMARADTALYAAKNAGRNCIVTAEQEAKTGREN
jgi:PleD family two-component response regulator